MPRRHDIDALRVIAFVLLILYHCAMVYVAEWDFHIKSTYQAQWLQWPMIAMNRWRMPLLFTISGIAIGLAQGEQRRRPFATARTWRLLLPLLFGMFIVVAPQTYFQIARNYGYTGSFVHFYRLYVTNGLCRDGQCLSTPTWNHLWYLAYLWPYTLLLIAAMPILHRLRRWLQQPAFPKTAAWSLAMLPTAWLVATRLCLAPRFPETHAWFGDWTVHAESLPLFLLGYVLAASPWFWTWVERMRWRTLTIAVLAISIELSLRWLSRYPPLGTPPQWALQVPWYGIERSARAIYTWLALLAIFGWGRVVLDRPFRWLPYSTEAVFPWYILHQTLIVALAYWLIPLRLGSVAEPLLVIGGTVIGCLLLHECFIRRIAWLRPLFGLKRKAPPAPLTIDATHSSG